MRTQLFSVRECFFFFFNDTATTEIYTLSLHDALPISVRFRISFWTSCVNPPILSQTSVCASGRSEEHTSELQSQSNLVCRLLLEKKNKKININIPTAIKKKMK